MQFRAVTASLLATSLLLLFAVLHAEKPRHSVEPVLLYTATPHYQAMAWLRGEERFPEGARLMLRDANQTRALVPGFSASADASLSYDGNKVLFAGKKSASDPWQIWEVPVSGGDPVRITSCSGCIRPFYLPEERIAFAMRVEESFQIFTASIADGQPVRITYSPGNAIPTDVLRDGRILFESNYPIGDGNKAELYTVYPDGSGVESYRCDHDESRHSGKQVQSGDIVFAKDSGMARFTSALAHEVPVPSTGGDFAGDVIETTSGEFVAAWRPDEKAFYSLQVSNQESGARRELLSQANTDTVQPQIVHPREVPNRFPSALHEWNGANVLCLNAYTSKLKLESKSIARVNLYTLVQREKKLLGSAGVASDGSFFLHVPSDQPLQIELVDASGKPLQREHGWFWMRRGEQRECIGCHAGPERAPENAVPEVLTKSTEPVDLAAPSPLAKGGR